MNSEQQQTFQKVLEYGTMVSRHWRQVVLAMCVCLLLFTAVIAKLPNEYEATTTILVDPQQVPEKYVSPAVSSDPGERLNTLTQQVLSRTRLQDIMNRFKLYAELRSKVSDEELVQQMRDHIRIQVRQGAGQQLSTFTITFQGKDPKVVADVTNELASSFIRWNVDVREQQVEGTQAFLSAELQAAKENLEQQEDKLRVFKMNHLGETPDQEASNLAAMSAIRTALQNSIEASSRLEQEKLLLSRLPQAAVPAGTPDVTLSKRGRLEIEKRQVEGDLRRLREAYSEKYPDVIKLRRRLEEVTAELNALPVDAPEVSDQTGEVSATSVRLDIIDKELKRMKADQARMQSQIGSYQAKLDAAPLREQQLLELTRNYDVSKQHYQTLLDKSFNIEMAASLEQKQKGERFTVLDPAQVPEKPVKPRRKLLLMVAALFSLLLPCSVVVGRQILSATVITEADLKTLIPSGVRVVGLIPQVENPAVRKKQRAMSLAVVLGSLVLCASAGWIFWQMRGIL